MTASPTSLSLLHRMTTLARMPNEALLAIWSATGVPAGDTDVEDDAEPTVFQLRPTTPVGEFTYRLLPGVRGSAMTTLMAGVRSTRFLNELLDSRNDAEVHRGVGLNPFADAYSLAKVGDKVRVAAYDAAKSGASPDELVEAITEHRLAPLAVATIAAGGAHADALVERLARAPWGPSGAPHRDFRAAVVESAEESSDAAVLALLGARIAATNGACMDAAAVIAAEAAVEAGLVDASEFEKKNFDTEGELIAKLETVHMAGLAPEQPDLRKILPEVPKSFSRYTAGAAGQIAVLDLLDDSTTAARLRLETTAGVDTADDMFSALLVADDQAVVDWMEKRTRVQPTPGKVIEFYSKLSPVRRNDINAEVARRIAAVEAVPGASGAPFDLNPEIALVYPALGGNLQLSDMTVRTIRAAISTAFRDNHDAWGLIVPVIVDGFDGSIAELAEGLKVF